MLSLNDLRKNLIVTLIELNNRDSVLSHFLKITFDTHSLEKCESVNLVSPSLCLLVSWATPTETFQLTPRTTPSPPSIGVSSWRHCYWGSVALPIARTTFSITDLIPSTEPGLFEDCCTCASFSSHGAASKCAYDEVTDCLLNEESLWMVLSTGVQRANMSRYQRTPLKNTDNVVEVKSKVSGWFINFTFIMRLPWTAVYLLIGYLIRHAHG